MKLNLDRQTRKFYKIPKGLESKGSDLDRQNGSCFLPNLTIINFHQESALTLLEISQSFVWGFF